MDQLELGKKIQELRKQNGLTQEELADKTGVSTRTIQRIENGEVDARTYTLNKLAEALKVELEELLGEDEISKSSNNESKKWLALFHLSGLFILIIPPLLLWIFKKDDIEELNDHAKDIFNYQLSMLLYLIASGFLVLILIGLPLLIFLSIYSTIIILINTIKVANGTEYKYPLNLNIIKKL